jgi:Ca2+-binding EF-hand superfamily protein
MELQALFHDMDIDGSQSLSTDEYHLALQNPRIVSVLSSLKLDSNDMSELIYLLDSDNSGEVEIDEFIVECLRLRG